MKRSLLLHGWLIAAIVASLVCAVSAPAYVEMTYTLGRLVNESVVVCTMRIEKVDKEKNLIIYRKVADIKGTHNQEVIKHNIGRGGFHPREWQNIMKWAEPGKLAVFMHNGSASETCIDGYWYQAYSGGEWWSMSHAEPYLNRSYVGKPEKLAAAVKQLLAGQEVVVPCVVDGDKNAIQLCTARVQRLKASLKLTEYDAKRDFQGWGGNEDFRKLLGMPGFSHYGGVSRVDPNALGIAPADFDGDGKPDFCLYGEGRAVLLQNDGKALNEQSLPVTGGARWAGWADYNGDKRPDLLLATPSGPRLFENLAAGLKDITGSLPREAYYNVTAATWIDADADGRPDILLANGFCGLRLYRNLGPGAQAARPAGPPMGKWYFCGPFDSPGVNGAFDKEYLPEKGVDINAAYPGKNGAQAKWKEGKFTDGQVNSLALFGGNNDQCAVYLYREMDFGSAVNLPVSLGSDDSLTIWLNGEKIFAENTSRAAMADSQILTLKLRPGKNQLLMKICNGSGDFGFYFAAKGAPEAMPPLFEDVSEKFGLGSGGVGGMLKGDHLAVADVNGDGRQDFLFSAGRGLLVLNTPQGFVAAPQSGLAFEAGGIQPVFGDYDGDGKPDLFVPQRGQSKLFKNQGNGTFADATAASGLGGLNGQATSGCFADFTGEKRLDLFVGCLRGSNRFFRNVGGKFVEATNDLGLNTRVFNTRGVLAMDLNGDGVVDVVFNNEGQESAVLLGVNAKALAMTADSK